MLSLPLPPPLFAAAVTLFCWRCECSRWPSREENCLQTNFLSSLPFSSSVGGERRMGSLLLQSTNGTLASVYCRSNCFPLFSAEVRHCASSIAMELGDGRNRTEQGPGDVARFHVFPSILELQFAVQNMAHDLAPMT